MTTKSTDWLDVLLWSLVAGAIAVMLWAAVQIANGPERENAQVLEMEGRK